MMRWVHVATCRTMREAQLAVFTQQGLSAEGEVRLETIAEDEFRVFVAFPDRERGDEI